VYFAITDGYRTNSLFFSARASFGHAIIDQQLEYIKILSKFCSAYIFDFPTTFSPLAYYWGIAVEPSDRSAGSFGDREVERLSHWRDNTEIGVFGSGGRVFYSPCDGYIRDVYPIMLLSEAHLMRNMDGATLLSFLTTDTSAKISHVHDRYSIEIANDELLMVQAAMDLYSISLSGKRLEH
jgi:hypothetical protein